MKKIKILTVALAICLALSGCSSKGPSQEEVEKAIADGSVTVEDALEKGWVTQEWVDAYMEENSVPAADKVAVNAVGEFETTTLSGEPFTKEDISGVTYLAFLDSGDEGTAAYVQALVDAIDEVRAAGADVVVCVKGEIQAEVFQDLPFTVIAYNESMQQALGQNDSMASGIPCTGAWYVDGSILSAWNAKVEAEDLANSAKSFVEMHAPEADGSDQTALDSSDTSNSTGAAGNMDSSHSGGTIGAAGRPEAGGGVPAGDMTGGAASRPGMGGSVPAGGMTGGTAAVPMG